MREDCEFCKDRYSNTVIKEYDYWKLELSLNQKYLGRSLVRLKRHVEDINDLKLDERQELFNDILPDTEKSLRKIFDPDTFNYSYIGMSCRHLHIHVIPRYRSERKFMGEVFSDENWGGHYKTEKTRKMEPGDELFDQIKLEIRDVIE